MDVIYSLIPGMTFFGLIFVGILIWAVKHGQYEDMEGNASRILLDDDEDALLRDDVVRQVKKTDDVSAPKN
jgi:cbb3-type cytochrome oxidase maturation protein